MFSCPVLVFHDFGLVYSRFYVHKMGDYLCHQLSCCNSWIGGWKPDAYILQRKTFCVGDNLIAELTKIESPILAFIFPWYTYKAGHSPTFHLIVSGDIDQRRCVTALR